MRQWSLIALSVALCLIESTLGLSNQFRRSRLLSNDGAHFLGSVLETRTSDTHEAVIQNPRNKEDLNVILPFIETPDSLGSSLWPSSLAGSIILHGCNSLTEGKNVLELGSGLGLGGLVAGRTAAHCTITDNDKELMELLQEQLDKLDNNHIKASYLDWRDSDPSQSNEDLSVYDVCLGFDVAYYFHLMAPLVNTIRQKRKKDKSIALVIGQANRETQWHIYHHVREGGYNQITDERDPPWDGTTRMFLYKLEVGVWQSQKEESPKVDGILPIAALLHTSEGVDDISLTDHDVVATQVDEDSQMMTF